MAVYVDNARIPYRRMLMSHLVADTVAELFEMADRIGLDRQHFQARSHPHFDVCAKYREKAIEAGAIPVDRRGMGEVLQRLRLMKSLDSTSSHPV